VTVAYFAEVDASGIVQRIIVAESAAWCAANLGGSWVEAPDPASPGSAVYPPLGWKSYPARTERFKVSTWNSPDTRTPPSPSGGDDTATLQAWFDALPANVVVNFPSAQTYQVSSLVFEGRSAWEIRGNGSTFNWDTVGGNSATWLLLSCSHISIDDLKIDGENPNPGINGGGALGYEGRHGVSIRSSSHVRLTNMDIRNVMADPVYIGMQTTGFPFSEHILLEGSFLGYNGRMGTAIVAGIDITIRGNTYRQIRRSCFDLEPNSAAQVIADVAIVDNDIDYFRLYGVACSGYPGTVRDIVIANNWTTDSAFTVLFETPLDGVRRGPITFTGNTDNSGGAGSGSNPGQVVSFIECDGVTVTNNRIPAQASRLMVSVRTDDCTDVTITGNQCPGADYVLYADGVFSNPPGNTLG